MIIKIDHKTRVKDIQKKISVAYPYLKIEFSDRPHREGAPTVKGHWYDESFRLLDIAKKPLPGSISIEPWDKTGRVEERFQARFGLYPQLFRKEDDKWIQTAGTDVFTLDEQNEIGRRSVERNTGSSWREREVLL